MIKYVFASQYRNATRTFLTMLGITVATVLVTFVLFSVNGLQHLLETQFVDRIFAANHIQISNAGGEDEESGDEKCDKLFPHVLEDIRKRENVTRATGIVYGPSVRVSDEELDTLEIANALKGANIDGDHPAVSSFQGYRDETLSAEEIWISQGMADQYDASVDDLLGRSVTLEMERPGNLEPLTRDVVIGGIADLNSYMLHIVLSEEFLLEISEDFKLIENKETYISENGYDSAFIEARAENREEVATFLEETYSFGQVITPKTFLSQINTATTVLRYIFLGLAAFSVFIAILTVSNSVFTTIYQQEREIGIMKAIGASWWQILGVFLGQAVVTALIGTLVGLGIAGMGMYIANPLIGDMFAHVGLSMDTFFRFDGRIVLMVLGGGLCVGAVAGLVPAIRASVMAPKKSLSSR